MIYFLAALMALMFTILGFMIHAFYFSKDEMVHKLYHDLQAAENELASQAKENANSQKEMDKSKALVQSLERQLEQRDGQLKALKNANQRQEEGLRAFREEATGLRRSAAVTAEPKKLTDASTLEGDPQAPGPEQKAQKVHSWKDILNNILGVLDKIENETRKQNW
jgi:hypothetical protein